MIALGNDVVDLNEVPRNGEKYYHRLIQSSFNHNELVDLPAHFSLQLKCAILWSAKEAAYKSLKKLNLVHEFTPKDIQVQFNSFEVNHAEGIVRAYDCELHLAVSFNENWVHSLSQLKEGILETSQVISCDATHSSQSTEVRKAVLMHFDPTVQVAKSAEGVPFLEASGKKLSNELSLSHHGNFAAYAIGL